MPSTLFWKYDHHLHYPAYSPMVRAKLIFCTIILVQSLDEIITKRTINLFIQSVETLSPLRVEDKNTRQSVENTRHSGSWMEQSFMETL